MQPTVDNGIASCYWAEHLGSAGGGLFSEPLSIIRHAGELTGYKGIFALFGHGSVIISVPPVGADEWRRYFMRLAAPLTPHELARLLRPFASKVIGPAFIGYADALPPPSHEARALSIEDVAAVASLRAACGEVEWEHGGAEVDVQPVSGVFANDRLVALAGYEIWGRTIAHISVITHPDHRGRGFGAAAVAHLSGHALAAGLLPQYRTLYSNAPSMRIADALGFAHFGTSVAARLEPAILLREVSADDLAIFFGHQLDPEARHRAAFTARDPEDRMAFMAHWNRVLGDAAVIGRTIVIEGQVAGHVMSYQEDGRCEVTYWLGRDYWGHGIAGRALAEFVAHTQCSRPLFARAAKDNTASLRVLEKCGFTRLAEGRGFANARGEEIEEWLLALQ